VRPANDALAVDDEDGGNGDDVVPLPGRLLQVDVEPLEPRVLGLVGLVQDAIGT
jgi:hypothetical protein